MQSPWYIPDEVSVFYERGSGVIDNHAYVGSLDSDEESYGVALTYYVGGPREVITYQSRQDFRDTMLALDRAESREAVPEKLADGIRVPIPGTGESIEFGGVSATILAMGLAATAYLVRRHKKRQSNEAHGHYHHTHPAP